VRWFPLALLFGASLAVAQNTPPTANAPDTGQNSRVEGTVLGLNGDPVRKATVRLQGTFSQAVQLPITYSETTDNGGKFVFDDVAPGRYTLSADKPGFVAARYGARSSTSPGTQLTLTVGTEMKDLAIKMTPQGVIAGKVIDQDGDPVASAQLQAMRFTYVRGRKQLQPAGGATTNDLGEYRLINLAPGRYYISATDRPPTQFSPQERPGRAGAVQEGNVATFYPNRADPAGAVAVEVAAGSEMRGIDIRLLQVKVYTVRGKVPDASGVLTSTVVSLTRKEDDGSLPPFLIGGGASQLRPDGTFEFRNIVPGTYVLELMRVIAVNTNPPTNTNLTGRVEVTVGEANIDDVVLPLSSGPAITGTVTLEDGDITAVLKPSQNTLVFNLMATESVLGGFANAEVKDDGTFRFNNVGATKYALNMVILPRGTYLKSARFGGQDVTKALIDVTSGTGGTLDLVLSSKAATITGSVQNEKGEALAGMTVTLWPKIPDASPTGGAQLGFTDENGAFKYRGLAPGDYYVATWEELDPGLAQSAEFLSHFTSEASAITLAEGGQESCDLKPVPGDKIAVEIAKLP